MITPRKVKYYEWEVLEKKPREIPGFYLFIILLVQPQSEKLEQRTDEILKTG